MRIIPLLIACLPLASCSTPPSADDIAAADDGACKSYGAQPGSQAYFQCRMTKDQERQQMRAAVLGAYLGRH